MFGKENHVHVHVHIHLAGDAREQLTSIENKVIAMALTQDDILKQIEEFPTVIANELGEIKTEIDKLKLNLDAEQQAGLQKISDRLATAKSSIEGMSDALRPAPTDPVVEPVTDPGVIGDPANPTVDGE